jgi:hypothetical protein
VARFDGGESTTGAGGLVVRLPLIPPKSATTPTAPGATAPTTTSSSRSPAGSPTTSAPSPATRVDCFLSPPLLSPVSSLPSPICRNVGRAFSGRTAFLPASAYNKPLVTPSPCLPVSPSAVNPVHTRQAGVSPRPRSIRVTREPCRLLGPPSVEPPRSPNHESRTPKRHCTPACRVRRKNSESDLSIFLILSAKSASVEQTQTRPFTDNGCLVR